MKQSKSKTIIGWNEFVTFPDWNIKQIRAKVDTGARTSAIHVENIRLRGSGHAWFDIIVRKYKNGAVKKTRVFAPIHRKVRLRVSSRHYEVRYSVVTNLQIGPYIKTVEMTLDDRQNMLYRMILGRTTLSRFPILVDVRKTKLLGKP